MSSQSKLTLNPIFKSCFLSFPTLLQGVHYLVENGLLEWRAESVAEFLYKEEGLNKTAIGNLLGERWSIHTANVGLTATFIKNHFKFKYISLGLL